MLEVLFLLLWRHGLAVPDSTIDEEDGLPTGCSFRNISNFIQIVCPMQGKDMLRCPYNSTFYRVILDDSGPKGVTQLCGGEHDPHFYQACWDTPAPIDIDRNRLLCGRFLCAGFEEDDLLPYRVLWSTSMCNRNKSCSSGRDEENCDDLYDEEFECDSETEVAATARCDTDRRCDCRHNCHDEMDCPGQGTHTYTCLPGEGTGRNVTYGNVCREECPGDHLYEELCETHTSSCHAPYLGHALRLTPYTRCLPWISCPDKRDQVNCSHPGDISLSCTVDGFPANISEYAVCPDSDRLSPHFGPYNGTALCDDAIDAQCIQISPECFIHKHQLCDGVEDCERGIDERVPLCDEFMPERKCARRYNKFSRTSGVGQDIPLAWIRDGVVDCVDGIDENVELWDTCYYESINYTRMESSNGTDGASTCADVFKCHPEGGSEGNVYVELKHLCDKDPSCAPESGICECVEENEPIHDKVHNTLGRTSYLMHCLPGLEGLQRMKGPCITGIFPKEQVLGVRKRLLHLPVKHQDCRHVFGELYVYLSLSGHCQDNGNGDKKNTFPSSSLLSPHACQHDFRDRIFTLANKTSLTIVQEGKDGFMLPNMFSCDNGRCIPYSEVCNLEDNCGDQSDELKCTNFFQCNDDNNRDHYSNRSIPLALVCNGRMDCADNSDECNNKCNPPQMIKLSGLRVSSWLIGMLAIMSNTFVIMKCLQALRKTRSLLGFVDRVFIGMISFGDFVVGWYLLLLAMFDLYKGTSYCVDQRHWLTSSSCMFLGILSTIGSQISLMAMTLISLSRVIVIRSTGITVNSEVTGSHRARIAGICTVVLVFSAALAVIPVLEVLEDNFVNSVHYPLNPMLKGFLPKNKLRDVIGVYYGRIGQNPMATRLELTWAQTRHLISGMFTNDYNGVTHRMRHFYGNDGVCLFKYFVSQDDPQVLYSWFVLLFNFTCFIIITFSYLLVTLVSFKSVTNFRYGGNHGNPHCHTIKTRNKKLHRKIALIIFTDFCCWVPFVIVNGLHTMGVIDANGWYALFSIIILPINSIINPFLYDNTLSGLFSRLYANVHRFMRLGHSNLGLRWKRTKRTEV